MKKPLYRHTQMYSDWLKGIKQAGCITVETGKTFKIILPTHKYLIAQEHLEFSELGLMRKIYYEAKAYMEKNPIDDKFLFRQAKSKNISVTCLKRNSAARYKHTLVHCYDLKNAYATFMFNKGIISLESFQQLWEVPKHKRMWIIGAMASTQYRTEYISGIPTKLPTVTKETKKVWNYVEWLVDEWMQKIYRKYYYWNKSPFALGYYVDCLFVLNDFPELIEIWRDEFYKDLYAENLASGYSKMILHKFDLDTKKITFGAEKIIETESEELMYNAAIGDTVFLEKLFFFSNNGMYSSNKLIESPAGSHP